MFHVDAYGPLTCPIQASTEEVKVEGHIPARVWMPPPRVGGTYPGAFTIHSATNVLQAANGRF
jgi:hypothetical protein